MRKTTVIIIVIFVALLVPITNGLPINGTYSNEMYIEKWEPLKNRISLTTLNPDKYNRQIKIETSDGFKRTGIIPIFEISNYQQATYIFTYVDDQTYAKLSLLKNGNLNPEVTDNYTVLSNWAATLTPNKRFTENGSP